MNKIIILGGPTASGKTDLALEIAAKFECEIINADSRQIYKYFNIGTNKGDVKRIENVELRIENFVIPKVNLEGKAFGWMFDFLEPNVEFTLSDYKKIVQKLIKQISNSKKVPLIVGGTGLYIDSIINNYNLSIEPDYKLREELKEKSINELQNILKSKNFDLSLLNSSDINNPHRLIRLIEKSFQINTIDENLPPKLDYLFLYPQFNRNDLMTKIDNRLDIMIKEGFIEEVQNLLEKGFKNTRPMNGIGYKEVKEYLEKAISLEECIEKIKQKHRNYAKRQITWFEGEGRGYNLTKIDNSNFYPIIEKFVNKQKTLAPLR